MAARHVVNNDVVVIHELGLPSSEVPVDVVISRHLDHVERGRELLSVQFLCEKISLELRSVLLKDADAPL